MRLDRVVPRRSAGQNEEVQPAEQPQRRVPGRLVADDRGDRRIVGIAPAELLVERRPALALPGLLLENLLPAQTSSADFACCAIAPNACGSLTASSASTLRSSGISALRKPDMNWL
jgi:hypothetical protein